MKCPKAQFRNMITENAAINLEKMSYSVDISPPTIVIGESFQAKLSNKGFLVIEMFVDDELFEVNVALEQ